MAPVTQDYWLSKAGKAERETLIPLIDRSIRMATGSPNLSWPALKSRAVIQNARRSTYDAALTASIVIAWLVRNTFRYW
jgi:hypothetical protein